MRDLAALTDTQLLQLARKLADTQPVTNTRTCVQLATALDPKYETRSHLTVIGDALTALADKQHDRLLITCPPRAGKSQTASIWGPTWWLMKHPTHRVVVASYGDQLAQRIGKAVRRNINEHGKRLNLALEYGSAAHQDWTVTTGGGLRSVGYGAGLTGHGADLLICDDPHKDRLDANSRTKRENVWQWWSSTALSRLAPGAPVIMILTRWHPDDLAGRVLDEEGTTTEGGRWLHLNMPAIATSNDDPIGRAIGDPLPHPRIPADDVEALRAHWEDKRRTSIVSDWHALYQGDPQPSENALITLQQLAQQRHYNPDVTPLKHAVAVDPSGGGRDSAGIIGGFLGDDKRLYITNDATLHGTADEWSTAACQLAADIDADVIYVENNYGADMARMVVRTAWKNLVLDNPGDPKYGRHAPRIVMIHAKKGKLLRAEPIAQQLLTDRIRFANHMPELEHEWAHWQPDHVDSPGRIDASCYLAYGLLPVEGAAAVISTVTGVSRSQVRSRAGAPRINRRPLRAA